MSSTHDDVRVDAYVDGELHPCEREAFLAELVQNPARQREIADVEKLKGLVRLAFENPPPAPSRPIRASREGRGMWMRCAIAGGAALLLIGAGFGTGWLIRGQRMATSYGLRIAEPTIQAPGVLLHLESIRGQDADAVLERTRAILNRYRGSDLHVELIVNGLALSLLKNGYFPYSREFARLMGAYPNLTVVACGESRSVLTADGQPLPLLKGVKVAPSAVDEVVKRLREGWVYVDQNGQRI